MKGKTLFLSALLASSGALFFAQSHISTQAHNSAVTALAVLANSESEQDSFFSTGQDGFIIKWTEDSLGEHYQVTDLAIKLAARSPNGSDIAVYETDGAAVNMVSIWNFKTLTRKCAFTFGTPITSLSYSAKGTYVLCGTASSKGTYFLNTQNNTISSKKLKESTGAVSMVITSDSENSAVAYSPTGTLSYYNIKTGEKKAKFFTESGLTQPCMFNNNVFFAGYRDGNIYVIQAVTGNTLKKIPVPGKEPVIFGSNRHENLYYLVNENRQFKMYMIQNDRNKDVIEPQLIRTFTGLKDGEALVCAAITASGTIFAGTNRGNVYKFDNSVAERVDVLQAMTDNMYDHIYDVAAAGDNFYFLTPASIVLSSYDNGAVDVKGSNPGHTNLISYNSNGVILWTKDSKKSVQFFDFSTGTASVIFTPENNLKSLKIYDDTLLSIEGSSTVNRYSIKEKTRENLYNGAGIQDALLYTENDLYVAKTTASNPAVPLLYVNTKTKETVPINLKGNVAYALSFDSSVEKPEIYGIIIGTDAQNKPLTSVFSYNPETKYSRHLLEERSEDPNAINYLSYPVLYTNMGKTKIRSYNLMAKRNFEYKRSASLPVKIAKNRTRLVVLNKDGSVSWYNPDMNGVIADWYLTTDGQWFEF